MSRHIQHDAMISSPIAGTLWNSTPQSGIQNMFAQVQAKVEHSDTKKAFQPIIRAEVEV